MRLTPHPLILSSPSDFFRLSYYHSSIGSRSMSPITNCVRLQPHDRDRLEDLIDQFEKAWKKLPPGTDSIEISDWLPSRGDPLRTPALVELIKSDLEIRWRAGRRVDLEFYINQFPELGPPASIPAGLIYEEYWVRCRYGDQLPLPEYQRRFPDQYAEVVRLVENQPVPPPPASIGVGGMSHPGYSTPSTSRTVPEPDWPNQGILPINTGYQLLNRINRGSFGEVWRGEAPGGIEVAVKIIFGSMAEKEAQRELHALELIKHLRHPFLLPIHAFWQLKDRLIIAMELANGSLRDYAEKRRRTGERLPA